MIASHLVAPSPNAAAFNLWSTELSACRETAEILGKNMIDRGQSNLIAHG